MKAKEASAELKKKAKIHEYRLEQAKIKMKKIESDDRDRCRKTAEILKEFEKHSGNGPFFESLLNVLLNFQGIPYKICKNICLLIKKKYLLNRGN